MEMYLSQEPGGSSDAGTHEFGEDATLYFGANLHLQFKEQSEQLYRNKQWSGITRNFDPITAWLRCSISQVFLERNVLDVATKFRPNRSDKRKGTRHITTEVQIVVT